MFLLRDLGMWIYLISSNHFSMNKKTVPFNTFDIVGILLNKIKQYFYIHKFIVYINDDYSIYLKRIKNQRC